MTELSTGALDEQVSYADQMRADVSYVRPPGRDGLFDLLGDLKGQRILDFGCGLGSYRPRIEARAATWVGLELSGPGCTVIGDGDRLPFGDAAFDGVLMAAVLEHMPNLDTAMREVRRVLKPGGRVFGYASFLEPFHGMSYYHMSHMGIDHLLTRHGFNATNIYPSENGTAFQIEALFFPRYVPVIQPMFRAITQQLFKGLMSMNRFFRRVMKSMSGSGTSEPNACYNDRYKEFLDLRFAVGFNFVATRIDAPAESPSGYGALAKK